MPMRWPDISCIKKIPPMLIVEIFLRVILFTTFFMTENLAPFIRVIQREEFWLYKFPSSPSVLENTRGFAPGNLAKSISRIFSPITTILSGFAVIGIIYGLNRKTSRAISALAVPTLALPLTGIFTNIVKISVGRPRPNFLSRCHGSRYISMSDSELASKPCTGDTMAVMDGLKSFPSGHSSVSFCVLGFASMYIAAQLRLIPRRKSVGSSWRLIITLIPLVIATLCAISRTCDYHHHWQDVVVGSIIGFIIAFVVYRQYFPSLASIHCYKAFPFVDFSTNSDAQNRSNVTDSLQEVASPDSEQGIFY